MAKAEFLLDNTRLTVYLSGEIDHHGARMVREEIDTQILKVMPTIVVINFSKVTFMDSSGVGLVLARYKLCKDRGASVYVEGVDRHTGRILSIAGIKTIQSVK